MSKTVALEVVSPGGKAAPMLKSGNDAAVAKELGKLFADAQTGMRRIVALGLFAWEIKERQLKHGQWGPWLAAHAPNLCRPHSVSGKMQPSHALENYMTLTEGVLEKVGFKTIGAYLDLVSNPPNGGICHHGKFLLCPPKKVPESMKPVREKICELVDGKTQSQLFFEFKQADEEGKPKVGRAKGCKGTTAAQRAAAAASVEQAEREATEARIVAVTAELTELADDAHAGDPLLPGITIENLEKAVGYMHRYLAGIRALRQPTA